MLMTGIHWKQRSFLTSSGQKIKNSSHVLELLNAIQKPKSLAIIKNSGNSMADTGSKRKPFGQPSKKKNNLGIAFHTITYITPQGHTWGCSRNSLRAR